MKKSVFFVLVVLSCLFAVSVSYAIKSSETDYKKIKIGDTITFGHYPQNAGGTDNTAISWTVYKISGTKALLFSDKLLALKPINNDSEKKASWKNSDLRKWLVGEFLDRAFTKEEKKQLISINHGGCSDKVSLMTQSEAETVFGHLTDANSAEKHLKRLLDAEFTTYAWYECYDSPQEAVNALSQMSSREFDWWTCASSNGQMIRIDTGFSYFYYSYMPAHALGGVRCVIQIDLKKAEYDVFFRFR